MRKILRIWKYSIGSFSDDKTEPYDNYVAAIRTLIFVSYMVTNAFIVSGVIRHWNNVDNQEMSTNAQCNYTIR
jgi:ATP/ADP translocase